MPPQCPCDDSFPERCRPDSRSAAQKLRVRQIGRRRPSRGSRDSACARRVRRCRLSKEPRRRQNLRIPPHQTVKVIPTAAVAFCWKCDRSWRFAPSADDAGRTETDLWSLRARHRRFAESLSPGRTPRTAGAASMSSAVDRSPSSSPRALPAQWGASGAPRLSGRVRWDVYCSLRYVSA